MHSAAFYYAVAAGAAMISVYAAYRFLRSARRDRIFADTPVVRIRSAAQGYVHVQGRAAPGSDDPIRAPLSGRSCVWWDYKIESRELDSDTHRKSEWRTVDQRASVAPFLLSDTDAHCLVGPIGAEITPTTKKVWYADLDRNQRYTERTIEAGAQLSVLGELRSHSEVSEVDQQASAVLTDWKKDQRTLLQRFDRNHDGRIDADEWEAARAAARTQVQAGGRGSSMERISVIGQTTHGAPFVISPLDARQLVNREKLKATLSLVATVLALIVTVWAVRTALRVEP